VGNTKQAKVICKSERALGSLTEQGKQKDPKPKVRKEGKCRYVQFVTGGMELSLQVRGVKNLNG
jgi:hypothetical protein